jgi:hypothetical protein
MPKVSELVHMTSTVAEDLLYVSQWQSGSGYISKYIEVGEFITQLNALYNVSGTLNRVSAFDTPDGLKDTEMYYDPALDNKAFGINGAPTAILDVQRIAGTTPSNLLRVANTALGANNGMFLNSLGTTFGVGLAAHTPPVGISYFSNNLGYLFRNSSASGQGVAYGDYNFEGAGGSDLDFKLINSTANKTSLVFENTSGHYELAFNQGGSGNDLYLRSASLNRGVFTQSGDFGFGELTPTARVHIKGVDSSFANKALRVVDGSSSSLLDIANDGHIGLKTSASSLYDIVFNTTNNNGGFVITATNNSYGMYITQNGIGNSLFLDNASSIRTTLKVFKGYSDFGGNIGVNTGILSYVGGYFAAPSLGGSDTHTILAINSNATSNSHNGVSAILSGAGAGIKTGLYSDVSGSTTQNRGLWVFRGDILASDGFGSMVLNGSSAHASAALEVKSPSAAPKGFLPPRMDTTNKNAIASPQSGLIVYDVSLNQMSYYNGTTWVNI